MPVYLSQATTLNEEIASSDRPLGRVMNSWAQIKLDNGLAGHAAQTQVSSQVQSLIHNLSFPWKTVEMTPQPVAIVVMDVLQQELDDAVNAERYRTTCMKCLRELCKARSAVPSSLFL